MINESADNAQIAFINGMLAQNNIDVLRLKKVITETQAKIGLFQYENNYLCQIRTELIRKSKVNPEKSLEGDHLYITEITASGSTTKHSEKCECRCRMPERAYERSE